MPGQCGNDYNNETIIKDWKPLAVSVKRSILDIEPGLLTLLSLPFYLRFCMSEIWQEIQNEYGKFTLLYSIRHKELT